MSGHEQVVLSANGRERDAASVAHFGIHDAIDPADTRPWLAGLLRSIRPPAPREGKKRPAIGAW
jgi:hypothetical protein